MNLPGTQLVKMGILEQYTVYFGHEIFVLEVNFIYESCIISYNLSPIWGMYDKVHISIIELRGGSNIIRKKSEEIIKVLNHWINFAEIMAGLAK